MGSGRPQPIIIPGPSGMGENYNYSNFELIPKEVGMAILGEILGAITRNREGGAIQNLLNAETRPPNAEGPTIANAEITAPQAGVRDKYAGMSKSDLTYLKPIIGQDLENAQAQTKGIGLLRALATSGEQINPTMKEYIKANPLEAIKLYASKNAPLSKIEQANLEHTIASTNQLNEHPYGFMSGKEGALYRTNPITGEVATAIEGTPNADLSYHVEDRPLSGNRIQKYRIFTNKMGDVVKEEKLGEAYTPNLSGLMGSFLPIGTQIGPDGSTNIVGINSKTGQPFSTPTPSGSPIQPKNQARLSSDAVTALSTFKTLRDTTESLLHDADKFKNQIGPAAGRVKSFENLFVTDKDYTDFKTRLGSLIETAYALSGKQISEKEIKMLEDRYIPSGNEPYGNFVSKLNRFKEWLANKEKTVKTGYESEGYVPLDLNNSVPAKPSTKSGTLNVGRFKVEVH